MKRRWRGLVRRHLLRRRNPSRRRLLWAPVLNTRHDRLWHFSDVTIASQHVRLRGRSRHDFFQLDHQTLRQVAASAVGPRRVMRLTPPAFGENGYDGSTIKSLAPRFRTARVFEKIALQGSDPYVRGTQRQIRAAAWTPICRTIHEIWELSEKP